MIVDTTPGSTPITLRYWSPMSVGVWALLVYGVFATVSFLEVLVFQGTIRHPLGTRLAAVLSGGTGRVFNVAGAVLGLFVASYTGVLLSVSNQPVWSDTWALGGLFLASGFSGSLALLGLLARREGATAGEAWLHPVESYVAVLELALLVLFLLTLVPIGTIGRTLGFPWTLLWLLVLVSLLPPLSALSGRRLLAGPGQAGFYAVAVPVLVLVGVFALRMAVIFSAQF
jgi:formate-dependent nitrite reductase membrane component NrfD